MRAIASTTAKGPTILIETDEAPTITSSAGGGGRIAGGPEATLERLKDVGETIAAVCNELQARIAESLKLAEPDELTLEFGVKLAGEAGVPLVTKGSVEGTFQVKATWKATKG